MNFARKFARRHKPIGDTSVRYGGRTLEVRIVLNTEQDAQALCDLAKKHLRGPKRDMCVCIVNAWDPEMAKQLWHSVDQQNNEQIAAIMEATAAMPSEEDN